MQADSIHISLPRHEALVLLNWLATLDGKANVQLDEPEQVVAWHLEGQLESLLVDVVASDYKDRVCDAKKYLE